MLHTDSSTPDGRVKRNRHGGMLFLGTTLALGSDAFLFPSLQLPPFHFSCYTLCMKFVVNPSYKHSPDLIKIFNKYKESIWFKDHAQYTDALIKDTIKAIDECKKLDLPSKYILWLTEHMYKNKLTFKVVSEDYIPQLKFHFYNQDILNPIHTYSSISELNTDIESLGEENETVSEKDLDIFFEKNGWILAMPHTTKASCLLGKNTDWCTARTKSQNLFLSYVGKFYEDVILFYVIKIDGNPKKNPNDKLSIGFRDGVPEFESNFGGITVNASNKEIDIEKFGEIVGNELAKEMLIKMDEKSQSIKGKHPAKKEMERIAKSLERYRKKVSEFKNEQELEDFNSQIAEYPVIEEIQYILARNDAWEVKYNLSSNQYLTEAVQDALYLGPNDETTEGALASNPTLFESVQIKISRRSDIYLLKSLAKNKGITEKVQLILLEKKITPVIKELAKNSSITKKVQQKIVDISNDTTTHSSVARQTLEELATNPNLHESTQIDISNNIEQSVRITLAKNPNLSEKVQLKLAGSYDETVKSTLAKNTNITEAAQLILSNNEGRFVRGSLAMNINITEMVQVQLSKDADIMVQTNLSKNEKISESVQKKLFKQDYLIEFLAQNKNLSESVQIMILNKKGFGYEIILASNPNITEKVQLMMIDIFGDANREVMRILFRNPATTDKVKKLMRDSGLTGQGSLYL